MHCEISELSPRDPYLADQLANFRFVFCDRELRKSCGDPILGRTPFCRSRDRPRHALASPKFQCPVYFVGGLRYPMFLPQFLAKTYIAQG
jgi:hypothetical protein